MKATAVLIALGTIAHVLKRESNTARVIESMMVGYGTALKPLHKEVDMPVEDTSLIKCYQCPTTMRRYLYADHEAAHDEANAALAKVELEMKMRQWREGQEAIRRARVEAHWSIEGTGHEDEVWKEPPAPQPDHYTIKETRERIRRRLI
jgi:hypothetical protein